MSKGSKKKGISGIVQRVEFTGSAVRAAQYPNDDMPEVAFGGRSNVGKSSLINALTGSSNIAKVSKKPGKTRLINFFTVKTKLGSIRFVDLPGYGFAKVSKKERQQWRDMIEGYLESRNQLRVVVLLVDSKVGPMETDILMGQFCMDAQIPFIIAATKADKLPKTQLFSARQKAARPFGLLPQDVFLVSSQTGDGLSDLWRAISAATGLS